MNSKVEKRRATLINIAFFAALIGILYVFLKYCFWLAAPFLLSFFFAVLLQRPLRWIDKKTKNKCHTLWSILLIVFSICVVLVPIILILIRIGSEVSNFLVYLKDQLNDFPTFLATLEKEILGFLKFLPDGIYTSLSDTITNAFGKLISDFDISALGIDMDAIKGGVSTGISGVFTVVKNIPSVLISIVIGIIAWIFFTKDYNYIVNFIKLQLPESKKNFLSEIKQVFSHTILRMVRAYALIMFITFCELFLGFTILSLVGIMNNSYIFVIAIGIAIFDILPVAGSGGVLMPWALFSLISGNLPQAIGLMVIYVAISVIRQYIEPKIVGSSLGVHPLVTLAGLYFGLKLFGFLGMFIVPLTVMTIKALNDTGRIHLYNAPERN